MSEIHKYINLIVKNTPYAKKMRALSNQIFGEVVRETSKNSMRVVKRFSVEPKYKMDYYINYYPRHSETGALFKHLRHYGLFRDEHADFTEEMIRLRALRGKVQRPFGSNIKKTKSLLDTKK